MRWCLLALVIGCGPTAGAEVQNGAEGRTSTAPQGANPSLSSPSPAPSSALTVEPMGPVLQAAIDAPQLDPYWHPAERPDRSPLVLVRFPALRGEPKLFKFGKPVEYAAHADVGARPHVEVQAIAIKPDRAHVVLGYPAEGIVAHIHLVREVGAWVVAKAEVVEH